MSFFEIFCVSYPVIEFNAYKNIWFQCISLDTPDVQGYAATNFRLLL